MKSGKITITGILIAILTGSLFITGMVYILFNIGSDYNLDGYDPTNLTKLDRRENITVAIDSATKTIDEATSDPSWFDFFSGILNVMLTPLKTMYRGYVDLKDIIIIGGNILDLPSFIIDYFVSVLVIIVVIGIVMFRIYLNREQ